VAYVYTSTLQNGSGVRGGGLNLDEWGQAHIFNSRILNNQADLGGGIYMRVGNTQTYITNTTFSQNRAINGNGGAIRGWSSISGNHELWVTNSTFDGNTATAIGGGLALANTTAHLRNLTIVNNSGNSSSGGIRLDANASLYMTNTLLTANTSLNTGTANCSFVGSVNGANNLSADSNCGAGAGFTTDSTANDFGSLGNNGGSVETIALLLSNGAIDAGLDTACPASDARGQSRPFDVAEIPNATNGCDIGAFEYKTPQVTFSKTATPSPARLNQPLTYTFFISSDQSLPHLVLNDELGDFQPYRTDIPPLTGIILNLPLDDETALNGHIFSDTSGTGNHAELVHDNGGADFSVPGYKGNGINFPINSPDDEFDFLRVSPISNFPSTEIAVSLWISTTDTSRQGTAFSYAVDSQSSNEFLLFDYDDLRVYRGNNDTPPPESVLQMVSGRICWFCGATPTTESKSTKTANCATKIPSAATASPLAVHWH
jgi:predicted outer membrane repeat protein